MMSDVCIKHYKYFKKPTIKIVKFSGKPVTSSGLLLMLHQIKKLNKQYHYNLIYKRNSKIYDLILTTLPTYSS